MSKLCVDKLCVSKLCEQVVCEQVVCEQVVCEQVVCVQVVCTSSCVTTCMLTRCVWTSCVWTSRSGGEAERRRCRTKNKNPTQRCGEKPAQAWRCMYFQTLRQRCGTLAFGRAAGHV